MNMKDEKNRVFLRVQKVLRELRFLRYDWIATPEKRKVVEKMLRDLGPISDELKAELDSMAGDRGDYDV